MSANQPRPTNMALAFLSAAVPCLQASGARAPWTARRVAINCDREIGNTVDHESIKLKHSTAKELQRKGYIE